jgi:hypothetical protein
MAVGSITRPNTLTSDVNHTAVMPTARTTQMLKKASASATIVSLFAFLTVPPVPPVRWRLSADDVSDNPFDFNGQKLELTR